MKKRRMICACMVILLAVSFIFPLKIQGAEGEEGGSGAVALTGEEQALVSSGRIYTIGCPPESCPVLFTDERTHEVRGITVDILEMVSQATGLQFQYRTLPFGDITYEDLREMKLDLVASVEYNAANADAHGIVMTAPYLHADKIFVCKKGVIFNPNGKMRIATASGSQTLAGVIRGMYPDFEITYYHTLEESLEAVKDGRADAALHNQYTMERILGNPRYEELQMVAAASIGDSQALGVLVPLDEARNNVVDEETACLLSVLNKGIASLDQREVSFAIIKETTENAYRPTLGDLLYRNWYVVLLAILCIGFIGYGLYRNRLLQQKHAESMAAERRSRELTAINEHMYEQQLLLEDALKNAEEGGRAKTSFLFNMSHDIRTPINAILGFTEVAIRHKDDAERVSDSLDKIRQSGRHLLQLVNDILDMSRIESGKMTLAENTCDLTGVIRKVKEIFQVELDKKNIRIRLDMAGVTDPHVCCDELKVNQILFNLLSNAVKFSRDHGEILVSLRQKPSEMEGYAAYELRVKDRGIGMAPEFQQHIFEPFERERTSTVSGIQGTGLGMPITRSLVELMGGSIRVDSEPDQGTEFVVNFVFRIQEAEKNLCAGETEAAVSYDFTGRRLLLAEDNELNREIAVALLNDAGFTVETAENGQEAVEMVRRSQPGYYDAVLMDIQMPVMDGYQATRLIRQTQEKALARIPVIAMTANAFDEDKKKALSYGMNSHISKPIDISVVLETLDQVLSESH